MSATTHCIRSLRRVVSLAVALVLLGVAVDARASGWQQRYEQAKSALVAGDDERALLEFEALAETAPSYEQRLLAEEFAALARERVLSKRLAPLSPGIRTPDELSLLYTTAFIYGFGTSGWLALQVKPQNAAGAVLPFIGITTATMGGVALADDYRPFRRGIPQSIAAGMILGLGQGSWIVGYQHAVASRRDDADHWSAETVSTVLWSGATVGAVSGGLIGAWQEPTPGEVSFTSATTLWTASLSGFVGFALESDESRRGEVAFLSSGVGYNAGLLTGILLGPKLSPSVTRMRFVNLGGVSGGLLALGTYLMATGNEADARGSLTSTSVGAGLGLAAGYWLTEDVDAVAKEATAKNYNVIPTLTPVQGGVIAGLSGTL